MLERLNVGEDEKAEDVQRRFDEELGVSRWKTPGSGGTQEQKTRIPGAPIWWDDDEEASDSFLRAHGVILDG